MPRHARDPSTEIAVVGGPSPVPYTPRQQEGRDRTHGLSLQRPLFSTSCMGGMCVQLCLVMVIACSYNALYGYR